MNSLHYPSLTRFGRWAWIKTNRSFFRTSTTAPTPSQRPPRCNSSPCLMFLPSFPFPPRPSALWRFRYASGQSGRECAISHARAPRLSLIALIVLLLGHIIVISTNPPTASSAIATRATSTYVATLSHISLVNSRHFNVTILILEEARQSLLRNRTADFATYESMEEAGRWGGIKDEKAGGRKDTREDEEDRDACRCSKWHPLRRQSVSLHLPLISKTAHELSHTLQVAKREGGKEGGRE